MRLTLGSYFSYLGSDVNSRNVTEGEEVLNAGHVILCGRHDTSSLENSINIYALCIQSSGVSNVPHEIKGDLGTLNNSVIKVGQFICTCKAGAGNKCKHISAVLLYCTRCNIQDLELVSTTDVKCVWNLRKSAVLEKYKPVPLCESRCISTLRNREAIDLQDLSNGDVQRYQKIFEACCPNSALAKHRLGRAELPGVVEQEHKGDFENYSPEIFNKAAQSILMMELGSSVIELANCCRDMYNNLLLSDVEEIEISTRNCDKIWAKERQFRITGSRCYGLYTYKKNDWEKKALDYFWPKKFSNVYTRHGIYYETKARRKYSDKYLSHVVETGLIISSSNPWLGYSPDGIVMENGIPTKLIEIKCPYSGKSNVLKDCIMECKFLDKSKVHLKTKHSYYGHVQMGMALLNLPECDFVIYSSFDDSIEVINVKYDECFARNLLQDVKSKYFNNMLHKLCANKTI